tara:strand:+ start:97 stop:660 length:564 start_codon:yes stop_codon:yes gene_type:complete
MDGGGGSTDICSRLCEEHSSRINEIAETLIKSAQRNAESCQRSLQRLQPDQDWAAQALQEDFCHYCKTLGKLVLPGEPSQSSKVPSLQELALLKIPPSQFTDAKNVLVEKIKQVVCEKFSMARSQLSNWHTDEVGKPTLLGGFSGPVYQQKNGISIPAGAPTDNPDERFNKALFLDILENITFSDVC